MRRKASKIVKCRWCAWTQPKWKRRKGEVRIAYPSLFQHVREQHREQLAEMESRVGKFGDGVYVVPKAEREGITAPQV